VGQQLVSLPADPGSVAAYLRAESEAGRAVATVRRRAATIACAHRAAGLTNPCQAETVRLAVRAIARERGTDQRQAPALGEREADRIAYVTGAPDAPLKDRRDLALVLVGRDLLARASELVSLTIESIAWDEADGTATINLRRRKTSTETQAYLIGQEAAEALRRWLEASGIASGPVWRSLTRGGKVKAAGINRRDVSRILKRLAARARLETSLSSHSLRVGMAQDMTAANIEGAAIMQAAGWTTPRMLTRYTGKLAAKRGAVAQYHARRHK
jgi:integrase